MSVANTEEFFDLLRESQLLSTESLEQTRAEAEGESDPTHLAKRFVGGGLLTGWQAKQLLAGRHSLVRGPYRLIDRMGRGTFGTVYAAEHQESGQRVALKILAPPFSENGEALRKLMVSSSDWQALEHPNLVRLADVGTEGGCYLVMEHVDGLNLEQIVSRQGPLPFDRIANYIRQVSRGLTVVHAHGMVHGSIKPLHLVVDNADRLRILGVALAQLFHSDNTTPLGGVDFVAPEQINDQPIDQRTDIYSLGCTMYFLLTGRPPYAGGDDKRIMQRHLEGSPPDVLKDRPDTPPEMIRLCIRLMAKNPEHRLHSVSEVARSLVAWPTDSNESAAAGVGGEVALKLDDDEGAASRADTATEAAALAAALAVADVDSALQRDGDDSQGAAPANAAANEITLEFDDDEDDDSENENVQQENIDLDEGKRYPAPDEVTVGRTNPAAAVTALDRVAQVERAEAGDTETANRRKWMMIGIGGAVAAVALVGVLGYLLSLPDGNKRSQQADSGAQSSQQSSAVAPGMMGPASVQRPGMGIEHGMPRGFRPGPDQGTDQDTEPVIDPYASLNATPESDSGMGPGGRRYPGGAWQNPHGEPRGGNGPRIGGLHYPGQEEPESEEEEPQGPFHDMPPSFDVPEPDGSSKPVLLGKVHADPDADEFQMELIGGDIAYKEGYQFLLTPLNSTFGKQQWDAWATNPQGTRTTQPFARFTVYPSGIGFQWSPEATSSLLFNFMRNCLLEVSVLGESHAIALRAPEIVPPLLVNMKRGEARVPYKIGTLEDLAPLQLAITGLEGDFPAHTIEPADGVPVDGGKITISLNEEIESAAESDEDEPTVEVNRIMELSIESKLTNKIQLVLTANYTLGDSDRSLRYTADSVERASTKLQERMKEAEERLDAMGVGAALHAQRDKLEDRIADMQADLGLYAELQSIDAAVNEAGEVHFRIFRVVHGHEVALVESELPEVEEDPAGGYNRGRHGRFRGALPDVDGRFSPAYPGRGLNTRGRR